MDNLGDAEEAFMDDLIEIVKYFVPKGMTPKGGQVFIPPAIVNPEGGWSSILWNMEEHEYVMRSIEHTQSKSLRGIIMLETRSRVPEPQRGLEYLFDEETGNTPLHFAAAQGDIPQARGWLRRGYSPNTRNKVGETPLHFAAREGNTRMAELLICRGACRNVRGDAGTPLDVALHERARFVYTPHHTEEDVDLYELHGRVVHRLMDILGQPVNYRRGEKKCGEKLRDLSIKFAMDWSRYFWPETQE